MDTHTHNAQLQAHTNIGPYPGCKRRDLGRLVMSFFMKTHECLQTAEPGGLCCFGCSLLGLLGLLGLLVLLDGF